MIIEGYFAVYNTETEVWPEAFEEIAPGAFDNTLSNDIGALINHALSIIPYAGEGWARRDRVD
jgi:HK97 family phage prohead protease